MRDRAVVALEEVLDDDLPVRLDHLIPAATAELERRRVETGAGERGGKVAERVSERRGARVRVDEDERTPRVHEHGMQRETRWIESRLSIRPRSGAQRPVEVVRPRVVRALQRLPATAALDHEVPAVPADVDEATQHPVRAPHDDDWHLAGLAGEELAGLHDVVRDACVLPGTPEDPLLLESVYLRVGVPACGEREPLLELAAERGGDADRHREPNATSRYGKNQGSER